MKHFNYKFLALKIYDAVRKNRQNFASWDDIGRPFQDCRCLDMRDFGLIALSSGTIKKPDGSRIRTTGVQFRDHNVVSMTPAEFLDYIRPMIQPLQDAGY